MIAIVIFDAMNLTNRKYVFLCSHFRDVSRSTESGNCFQGFLIEDHIWFNPRSSEQVIQSVSRQGHLTCRWLLRTEPYHYAASWAENPKGLYVLSAFFSHFCAWGSGRSFALLSELLEPGRNALSKVPAFYLEVSKKKNILSTGSQVNICSKPSDGDLWAQGAGES